MQPRDSVVDRETRHLVGAARDAAASSSIVFYLVASELVARDALELDETVEELAKRVATAAIDAIMVRGIDVPLQTRLRAAAHACDRVSRRCHMIAQALERHAEGPG